MTVHNILKRENKMDREKLIYKWYLISAIVISSITILILIYALTSYIDSSYLMISAWGSIASFWLYFNLIVITLIFFNKVKDFNLLLPSLYIFGEIFSGIVVGILNFVASKRGVDPLLMSSGTLAIILHMLFPIITIIVAIASLYFFRKKNKNYRKTISPKNP